MSEISIRNATVEDGKKVFEFINKLADYERLTDKVESSEEDISFALAGTASLLRDLFVMEDEEEIGFCTYYFAYTTFFGTQKLFVEDLFVEPHKRRLGAGKALFSGLAKIAHENNCVRMELQVLDWNDSAVEFYEALGAEFVSNWLPYSLEKEFYSKLL